MLLVYSADNKKSHSYFTRCYIQNILVIFITCQICDSVMEEMWVLPWQWHCFPWQLAWVVSLCEVYLYTDYGAKNSGIQGCVLYIMKQKKLWRKFNQQNCINLWIKTKNNQQCKHASVTLTSTLQTSSAMAKVLATKYSPQHQCSHRNQDLDIWIRSSSSLLNSQKSPTPNFIHCYLFLLFYRSVDHDV